MKVISLPCPEWLFWSACWHVGNPMCREAFIADMLLRVRKTKNANLLLGGDQIEAIAPIDKRYCAESHDQTVVNQLQKYASFLAPVKKQLAGMIMGNHEYKLKYLGNVCKLVLDMAQIDKAKFLGGVGYINFITNNAKILRTVCGHSSFSHGKAIGNKETYEARVQARLRASLEHWDADLKLAAHSHHGLVAPPMSLDKLSTQGGEVKMRPDKFIDYWCAISPSMFASYDDLEMPSYAEIAMLPPTDIGYVVVKINKKHAVVENIEIVKG